MSDTPLILIALKPGVLRDGLYAMAQALPNIERVEQVDSIEDVQRHIEESPLRLAFLEAALLKEECAEIIRKIKGQHPDTRCVVIVSSQNELLFAEQAGADAVYISGDGAGGQGESIN